MKLVHAMASIALLAASQAHAMNTIMPNALVATATGQADGREIFFTLPLNGDTSRCVVTLNYGERPGVGINSDGDTFLNGNRVMLRTRTYSADGIYTFTARAKSGCTGEARVTFTVGRLSRAATPSNTNSAISANTSHTP